MAEPEQRTIRNLITRSVIKLSPLSFHPFPGSRYRDVSFSFKCIFLLKIEIFWLSEGGLEWGKDRKVSIIPGSWFHSTPWLQKYKSFLVFPYSRPCLPLNPTLEILFSRRKRKTKRESNLQFAAFSRLAWLRSGGHASSLTASSGPLTAPFRASLARRRQWAKCKAPGSSESKRYPRAMYKKTTTEVGLPSPLFLSC